MKYVLVSGGVISDIGKGIIASSTGLLLKTLSLRVTALKIDPYMNINVGTMSPLEHGEVFVLYDGANLITLPFRIFYLLDIETLIGEDCLVLS